jgi:hypothetical protein
MKFSPVLYGAAFSVLGLAVSPQLIFAKTASTRTVTTKTASTTTVTSRSWVRLKATTDQRRYTPGQSIKVHLTATNTHNRGSYLRFTSGQRFDFTVYPVGSNESAYTWSAARMFIQSLGSLWLKPGQSQSYEAAVGDEMGSLKPGRYRLVARLTNSPSRIFAAPVEFEITGRGLAMTTRTDKTTYKIGEPVRIDVAVANRAAAANRVNITSGMACDVFISDEAGNPVWNYGANLRFIRVLGDVTWQKGETKNYSFEWNGVALPRETTATTLQPGRYRVQAVLQTNPEFQAPPVFINIAQ